MAEITATLADRHCLNQEKDLEALPRTGGEARTMRKQEGERTSGGRSWITGGALAAQTSSQGKLIMDSGATSHMCSDQHLFKDFHTLDHEQEVTLGDWHALEATGQGKSRYR